MVAWPSYSRLGWNWLVWKCSFEQNNRHVDNPILGGRPSWQLLSTPKFLRPNIASLMVEIPFVIALQLWQLWFLITCWLGSSQGPRWQTTVDLHLCFPWVSPRMSLLEITLHFDSMYPISAYLYWFRANTMLNDDLLFICFSCRSLSAGTVTANKVQPNAPYCWLGTPCTACVS